MWARESWSVTTSDPVKHYVVLTSLSDSARVVRPRTPSGYETPLKYYPMNIEHTRSANTNGETEPLLSLLTSSHPWLGGTISGSMSAYSSTKHHSPRFIQNSAEFVERHIGSPVTHTINSVGKKTGVETSLRKYLGSKQHHQESDLIDPEILGEESSNKRRRISSEQEDDGMNLPVQRTLSGSISVETLPVYDDNRSPAYEATDSTGILKSRQRPAVARSWSTQLMISTSGLGAALNEASLRSLKYVLAMLRSANKHVGDLMEALKKLLQEYDANRSPSSPSKLEEGGSNEKNGAIHSDEPPSSSTIIAQRIRHLNAEIWRTLKSVVNNVSKYTGGALPENASVIVRWQLMSVPHRWQRAVSAHAQTNEKSGNDESEALISAHRMMAFGVEGIDMMQQVGGVVESTIESAERWLGSLGRKTQQSSAPQEAASTAGTVTGRQSEDVNMGDSQSNADMHSTPQEEGAESILTDTTS